MYKKKAILIADAIKARHPTADITLNPEKPRSKSFEVSVRLGDGGEVVSVWSGLKKGPPRALKFPEPSVVLDGIDKAMGA
mgnify:CR=1 FL=1